MSDYIGESRVQAEVQLNVLESQQHRHRQDGFGSFGDRSSGSVSFFQPSSELSRVGGSGHGALDGGGYKMAEKRIIQFALQLAFLEKAASVLSALDFAWATVVVLGGFASSLSLLDFWSMATILFGEGTRIFSRGKELKWHQYSTRVSAAPGPSICLCRRAIAWWRAGATVEPHSSSTSTATATGQARGIVLVPDAAQRASRPGLHESPLLHAGWVFVSEGAGAVLWILQMLSAMACVALSVIGLCKHKYYGDTTGESGNQKWALVLFYAIALGVAALLLLHKAYWRWKVFCRKLLDEVSSECELGPCGPVALRRFFYHASSQCISSSIFDGVKMDLVTFAKDLIQSNFLDDQLTGVCILRQFAGSKKYGPETLRKVGTSARSIERLVEMLNWDSPDEEQLRRYAAEVVSELVGSSQSALRIAGIHGSVESVMSLLHTKPKPADEAASSGYDYMRFNLVGLFILVELARDHDNCGKIGSVPGLLWSIVKFTHVPPELLMLSPEVLAAPRYSQSQSQICAAKRSIEVLKLLVTTTGNTGKRLRQEVACRVFTVSNLRGILQHGERHKELQKLAVDVLAGLAMDDRAKEGIGRTGGVVKLLLSLFLNPDRACDSSGLSSRAGGDEELLLSQCLSADRAHDCDLSLSSRAGEALVMLALESSTNCSVILGTEGVVDRLVAALLDDAALRLNAARILRNLCAYSTEEYSVRLSAVTAAMPVVLRMTMRKTESERLLEASVGLTIQICKFLGAEQFAAELRGASVGEAAYVKRLVGILRQYTHPEIRVPRIRRFVVLQAIWLMRAPSDYVERFRRLDMASLLDSVADTTSDLECFHVFSGSVGLHQHRTSFSAIIESARTLLLGASAQQPI